MGQLCSKRYNQIAELRKIDNLQRDRNRYHASAKIEEENAQRAYTLGDEAKARRLLRNSIELEEQGNTIDIIVQRHRKRYFRNERAAIDDTFVKDIDAEIREADRMLKSEAKNAKKKMELNSKLEAVDTLEEIGKEESDTHVDRVSDMLDKRWGIMQENAKALRNEKDALAVLRRAPSVRSGSVVQLKQGGRGEQRGVDKSTD